jgi:pSer/pThr/pTyr-binding forkhead associated (FHA) protein
MIARLIPLDGSPPIDVQKDLIVIGRSEDCDLRIDHKSVSKLHCVITRTDGLLMLRDLGSTNGTRVNGQRVRRATLLPNDQLHFASVGYKVFIGVAEASPPKVEVEYTQQLNAEDVQRLAKKAENPGDLDSEIDLDIPLLQANSLPDVYPDKDDKN